MVLLPVFSVVLSEKTFILFMFGAFLIAALGLRGCDWVRVLVVVCLELLSLLGDLSFCVLGMLLYTRL